MKRRSRILLTGLAAAAALSCDEGRLLTEVERQPVKVEVSAPSGPESLLVGETGTYTTTVRAGETVLEPEVLTFDWSARPPGLLAIDTSDGSTVTARALSPGVATLTARAAHPDIRQDSSVIQIRLLLQGVAAVAPRSGDTTLAAVGDAFTVRGRGYGKDDISAGSAGLSWTHRGSALSVDTAVNGVDSLRVTAVRPGTDTLIFSVAEDVCAQGSCTDTILVRVVPVPVRIEVSDTIRLFTLGRSVTPTVRVFDANANVITGAAVEWSLATAADTVTARVSDAGAITARGNGIAAVVARAGTVEDTVLATVQQSIAEVVAPDSVSLRALQAVGTVALAAADSGGAALERPYDVDWRSRDEGVVSVSVQSDGEAQLTAVGTGATYVVGETETHADSVWVRVTQVPATIRVQSDLDTLDALAQTTQFTAEIHDDNGNPVPAAELTWSSADPGVATVSSDGVVTAVSVGGTTIAAEAGGVRDSAALVVRQVPARVTASVPATLTFFGATATLTASAEDANGHAIPSPALTWTIIDDGAGAGVITLTGDVITAIDNGTADLLVSSGEAMDTVAAIVTQAVGTVALDTAALSFDALQVPDTVTLDVLDPGGSEVTRAFSIDWSSSAASVATVAGLTDRRAAITSQGDGSATVTATVEGVSDSLTVTVAQVVDSLAIVPSADTLNALGDTLTLSATALDRNGQAVAGAAIGWSTTAPTVVDTVDATTGRVYSVATGVAMITATAAGVTDSATITSRQVAATVTVTPAVAADTLLAGDTLRFAATVSDSNGVAIPGTATWSTGSGAVATVSASGLVTAQTVTALDSTPVIATFSPAADSVWVFVEPTTLSSVVVAPDSVRLTALGATVQLSAEAVNQNGNAIPGETVTWTSLAPGIATVDGAGMVTAVANGTTHVVATSDSDATVRDTAKVVVEQVVASVAVTPDSHTFDALTATHQFSAVARDSGGVAIAEKSFTWLDDAASPGVISVDGTGLVTANQVGASQVIALADGVADSAEVTIRQVPASISMTPAVDTVAVGGTVALTAVVRDSANVPIPDTAVAVTWASLDPATTVDTAGVVSGVAITDSVRIRAHPTGHDHIRATSRITVVSSYVLEFDGGDYGNAGDVLALDTAWTIEAWVKPDSTSGIQYLLARGGSSASGAGSYGLYLSAGRPAVFIRSGPGGSGGGNASKQDDLVSATTLSTTAWSHVAVSYDGDQLRMYINGEATEVKASANTPQTAADSLIFGASDTTAANPLMGKLDEVRFWSVVRTAAEIASAYGSTLTGSEAGLLAWWPFSAGSGDPVDRKGGRPLTLPAPPNDPAWTAEYPKIP